MNYKTLKNIYVSNREWLFLLVFIAYYSSLILKATMFEQNEGFAFVLEVIRKISYLGIVGLFALNVLFGQFKRKEIWIYILVTGFLTVLAWYSTNIVTVVLWLFMCCAKDISFKRIIKYSLISSCTILLLSFFASQFGIVEDLMFKRDGEFVRHSFGFQYTTNIANFYLPIILMYMLLKKKINIFELLILFAIHVYIYITTDTKSIFAFGLIAFILYIICVKGFVNGRLKDSIMYFSVAVSPLAFAFCMLLQHLYRVGGEFITKVNDILSNRLVLAQNGINTFGIHLVGKYIDWNGGAAGDAGPYNYVDSSFIQYLLNFGILYILFVIAVYILFGIKAKKENNLIFAIILIVIVGHSIFDPQLMWLEFNPFLLYAFAKDDTYTA